MSERTRKSRRAILAGGVAVGAALAFAPTAFARRRHLVPQPIPAPAPAPTPTPVPAQPPASSPSPLPISRALYPNLLLPANTFFAASTNFKPDKKVFAHYMVCLAIFGGSSQTVEGAMQEILMAQSMGLDGFALNEGQWLSGDSFDVYQATTKNFFAAAQQLGTGFQLFFSADMSSLGGAADIVDMMKIYAAHPNYLKRNGLPVLSTFGGQGNLAKGSPITFWNNVLSSLRAAGINSFFVPGFYPVTASGTPAAEVAFWGNVIDGLVNWPAIENVATNPAADIAANNEELTTALAKAGKLSMPSFFNMYWGSAQNSDGRRYFEFQGGAGADRQWQSIINIQDADWVEIMTWNDLAESYMMPIDDPAKYNAWGVPTGWWKSHRGFAELNRYYIQWFKTGVQPTITKDALFYVYRTQSMSLRASNDPDGPVSTFVGPVSDQIYVTTMLRAAAQLTVSTGGNKTVTNVPAGVGQTMIPFKTGAQIFSLARNGTAINSIQGENIVASSTLYDFWNTTGFIET